jgi:glyoxylase-like metal-dependent hydrolase (beta-lactamase superfamily II)
MSTPKPTTTTPTPDETPAERAARDVAALPPAPTVFQIEVGLVQNFCEIIYCPTTREAAVVDPAWEADRLLREAKTLGVQIKTVLVTHTHNDHIEGVAEIVAATGAAVVVSPREAAAIRRVAPDAGALVDAVDRRDLAIGRCGLRVLETTGHTVGGVCYLGDGFVVTGDVMFVGGCGRTDFTGGDTAAMWRSLQRLGALPEETKVFPGHNYGQTPTSTIAHELRTNPYLLCPDFDSFRALRERPRR